MASLQGTEDRDRESRGRNGKPFQDWKMGSCDGTNDSMMKLEVYIRG